VCSSPIRFVAAVLFGSLFATACNSCERRNEERRSVRQPSRSSPARPEAECSVAQDCSDDDPCTVETCEQGQCATSLAPAGTDCDNGNPCDGVARCDGEGRCTGTLPQIDDGNACTVDSCDPATGVSHRPIAIDDGDVCTADSCDPRTGTINHDSVDVDDADDCTVDSCDPKTGVSHRQTESAYTCQATCEPGFHPVSRARSLKCGSPGGVRTFCAPDCGAAFHTCDARCPPGYDRRSETRGGQCGPDSPSILYCVRP